MSDRTFVKVCDCRRATASGPRYVFVTKPEHYDGEVFRVTMTLVDFACDKCDTPWVEKTPDGDPA